MNLVLNPLQGLLLSCTLAGAALAQAHDMLDLNGDGLLTLDELQAVYPEVGEAAFVQADTDGDGLLDPDELAVARTAGLIPDVAG